MFQADHKNHITSDAKRRGLIVLFFAAFPLLMPSLVYAVILFFTDIESLRSVGEKSEYAEITFPQKDKAVTNHFKATGVLHKVPKDHFAYLTSSSDDLFWPKIKLTTGEWSLNMTASGESGYKYNLSVISLPKGDHLSIEKWFQNGSATGKYPPLKKPKNLNVLATIKVMK